MTPPDGLVDPSTASGSVAPETLPPARRNRTAIAAPAASALTSFGAGSIIGIFVGSVTLLISVIVIVMGMSSW